MKNTCDILNCQHLWKHPSYN